MRKLKVCLYQKGARMLERNEEGDWELDGKPIDQEQAICQLVGAVSDLGYWCQVAKDVLPDEDFQTVQEAYEYHEN